MPAPKATRVPAIRMISGSVRVFCFMLDFVCKLVATKREPGKCVRKRTAGFTGGRERPPQPASILQDIRRRCLKFEGESRKQPRANFVAEPLANAEDGRGVSLLAVFP
jgi:hypothetical protein